MKNLIFFTGAFKVLDDGGLNVCHRIHSIPDDVYDDDVISWVISKDDKEMFSDGYVSNKGNRITIRISPECYTDKAIHSVKDFFLHEEKEIGLNVKIVSFRGWDIDEFVVGIKRGPFRCLKEADATMPDSEFVVSHNQNKNIFRCAVDQAWLDMCRTLRVNKRKAKKLEICKEYMAEALEGYFSNKPKKTESAFDGWHNGTTFNFRAAGLTVGQSQKILNMAMKYLYCCQDFRATKKDHFRFCHMPLDGYILNWYKSFVDEDYDNELWSKIDDPVKYRSIVRKSRQALGTENVLEKEFAIWRTEKEKAEKKELRSCVNRIIENPMCPRELIELLQEFCDELQD